MLQAAHREASSATSFIYSSGSRELLHLPPFEDSSSSDAFIPPSLITAEDPSVTAAALAASAVLVGGVNITTMATTNLLNNMNGDGMDVGNAAYDDDDDQDDDNGSFDGGGGGGKGGRAKSRRELPAGAVATLKAWLLSPEHFTHPYPTPQDQMMLMQKTGIDKKQLKNWFTNARRRIWKPMLKKQIEQGKITTTGSSAGGVPGLIIPALSGTAALSGGGAAAGMPSAMDNPHSIQAMRAHYQQAVQQQNQQTSNATGQQQSTDLYGNPVYLSAATTSSSAADGSDQYYVSAPSGDPPSHGQPHQQFQSLHPLIAGSASIGSLPQIPSSVHLSKTDSHAVLMELFARDQDLVRQATESARLKAETRGLGAQGSGAQQQQSGPPVTQSSSSSPDTGTGNAAPSSSRQSQQQQQQTSPMPSPNLRKAPSSQGLPTVPTLNSWPHFSSINSLNNLGTIPGVKSITSLSGADLANRGNVNRMGNLAQVKSMESMGKNDSYAFLEVFFGDRSSTNLSGMGGKDGKSLLKNGGGGGGSGGGGGGGGMAGEEDNEIGLSLEDESPSHHQSMSRKDGLMGGSMASVTVTSSASQDSLMGSGTLKRAFDDAMAARGLMSVSRSSERLTDLELPAKIQRTLSQELMNKGTGAPPTSSFLSYAYSFAQTPDAAATQSSHQQQQQQYPGQQAVEPPVDYSVSGSSETDGHVKVSLATACAICHQTNVDTQLRPCGHMFHERCLKPSLQTPLGQPRCPVDDVQMHCAVLAIPTEEIAPPKAAPTQEQQPSSSSSDPQQPSSSGWTAYSSSVPAPSNGSS